MIKHKTKLEDVAKLAGVSLATVSRVLNHPGIVRPELRDKVSQAVASLSYTRDAAARALKSGRTHTIGAVVPTLGISIFAEGVEALQNRLSEHGYTLLLANSQYDLKKELQEVRALIERGVDAIVLVGDSSSNEVHALIKKHGIPVVITYVAHSKRGTPAIGIDNEAATRDMTRYLMGLGHREVGVIANVPAANDRSRARLAGILKTLEEAGIALPKSRLIKAEHSLVQGRMGLQQLMKSHPQITAIICTTDTLAVGAMTEARAMGIHVPGALSITGFDDIELSSQLEPPLTTVSIPAAEIGRGAADHLINAISGLPIPLVTDLPFRIVIRGTTAKARTTNPRRLARA
ncbi:LacI family DNA-binding transcriptional regulator [Roseixanthobacter pseudopolyaromaticivorans]|uniref:LacI family DNA-binding transcriptional regulator n=1 Tax=Xanthobacteraceae TaxID=335928 RepID=UPI00372C87B5